MSARVVVLDGRQHAAVSLDLGSLARIGEVEGRQQAQLRTVYLALNEAAAVGDSKGWTRKALAERAGVSGQILARAIEALCALGLARLSPDGAIWLGTASVARVPLPEIEPGPVPERASERAAAFWSYHAGVIEGIGNPRPPRSPEQLRAADQILAVEPDAGQIKRRLEFALAHRFYADKVLTMRGFARWYAKINAAFRAEANAPARGSERPDVAPARHVSYDGERLEVAS